jgi:hypothetical protein
MGILDIIQQYAEPSRQNSGASVAHFDQVSQEAAPELIGKGLAAAFRSETTPPFSEQVAELFGRSNGQQQAGLLNQLLGSVNPSSLSGLAGGALTRMFGVGGAGAAAATSQAVTPTQASQLTSDQVKEIAAHAESRDPGIVDRVGTFYAQHPDLVKTLGAGALALILSKMARPVLVGGKGD